MECLEAEYTEFLREKLRHGDSIIDLQKSECYSEPLEKTIVEYYLNQNFYVACTLGNLVIDGVLIRVSQRTSSRENTRWI